MRTPPPTPRNETTFATTDMSEAREVLDTIYG